MTKNTHPLESSTDARGYYERTVSRNANAIAAWRRAVLATTGHLPTWAERQRRKPKAVPVPGKA